MRQFYFIPFSYGLWVLWSDTSFWLTLHIFLKYCIDNVTENSHDGCMDDLLFCALFNSASAKALDKRQYMMIIIRDNFC